MCRIRPLRPRVRWRFGIWRGPKASGGLRPGRRWTDQRPYGLGWSSYSQPEEATATSDLSRACRAWYSRRLKETRTTAGQEKALAYSGEMADGSTASIKDLSITVPKHRKPLLPPDLRSRP